jgi:hypothetical protein
MPANDKKMQFLSPCLTPISQIPILNGRKFERVVETLVHEDFIECPVYDLFNDSRL